jgi:diguanylate cyclase (GGDEF)-like protein
MQHSRDAAHPRVSRLIVIAAVAGLLSLVQQAYAIWSAGGLAGLAPLQLAIALCTLVICASVAAIFYFNLAEMRSMSDLAYSDELTGLPNRRDFAKRLSEELIRKRRVTDGRVGILYFDLDRFKLINDSYGHEAGDQLIRAFGRRVASLLRSGDFLARLSGDEFAAVVTGISGETDIEIVARRVFAAMREPVQFRGKSIYAGVSIGATIVADPSLSPDEALRQADFALLRAKESGRNQLQLFDPGMESQIRARGVLENDVREAIANSHFEISYQPLVSRGDKRVHGVEALLRWRHRERGYVPPSLFIPVAEEIGMIDQLGEFVLRKACEDLRTFPDLSLAVNVSPLQFVQRGFVDRVRSILAGTGFAAGRLELEITESCFVRDADAARAAIESLRSLGVKIALDDFGAGFSSMSFLRDYPLDRIKIDRSFVADVERSDKSLMLVSHLIDLGTALGLNVTLEGVETQNQFDLFSAKGCELQGYLFSRPVSLEKLAAHCADRERQGPDSDAAGTPRPLPLRRAS